MIRVFTHPPLILHSTSSPGFAHWGKQTEFNLMLWHVAKWVRFANTSRKFVGFLTLKIREAKLLILGQFSAWQKYARCWKTGSEFLPTIVNADYELEDKNSSVLVVNSKCYVTLQALNWSALWPVVKRSCQNE